MTELLGCPFCGEAPRCGSSYGNAEDEPNAFCFECPNGCSVSKERPTYDEAITAWNTRPQALAHDAIQGALALYLKEVQPVDGRAQINISFNELNVLRRLAATHGGGAHSFEQLENISYEISALAREGRAIDGTVLGALIEVQKRAAAAGGEANTKLVYIKRWRTIIRVPEKYADEIVDALRAQPASPAVGGEVVAWFCELASSVDNNREYGGWQPHLSRSKPNVPEGSIRNLQSLYAAQPASPLRQDWSCVADFLDDIEVDAAGMCRWSDVANAQTLIRQSMPAAPPASQPAPGGEGMAALEPFAKIARDVLENHPGWAHPTFHGDWCGYRLTYADFERAAAFPPASPLRGRERYELAEFLCEKLALESFDSLSRDKYLGDAKAILEFLASPPEQPAAAKGDDK